MLNRIKELEKKLENVRLQKGVRSFWEGGNVYLDIFEYGDAVAVFGDVEKVRLGVIAHEPSVIFFEKGDEICMHYSSSYCYEEEAISALTGAINWLEANR